MGWREVGRLIHDHALFAHVKSSLASTLVGTVLQADDVLSFTNLVFREFTLVFGGQLGSKGWAGVFGMGLALEKSMKEHD